MAARVDIVRSPGQWYQDDYPPKARWNHVGLWGSHTTETPSYSRHGGGLPGWPGYDAGAKAPNRTVLPDLRNQRLLKRDHFDLRVSSRALRNEADEPGETNAVPCGIVQTELVGTCSPDVSRKWQARGLVPDVDYVEWWRPPGWVLDGLAQMWVEDFVPLGVPLRLASPLWPAYPSSPALDRRARMDHHQFGAARGLIGHLHVPENTHLDPGAFPAADLLRRALTLAGQAPAPTPQEDDVDLTDKVPRGTHAAAQLGPDHETVAQLLTLAAQGGLWAQAALRGIAGLAARVGALEAAVHAPGVLTEQELTDAAERAVRNVLGDVLAAAAGAVDPPAGA